MAKFKEKFYVYYITYAVILFYILQWHLQRNTEKAM